jgi:ferredoxin--NADP+ reductase
VTRPLRVAIVGAGPAGLYAAEHLLRNRSVEARIDIFDRLPTPWGLIRAGVAPDHPEKKLIVDRLFGFTLSDQRVRFIGNVEMGSTVDLRELSSWYDAVIVSTGGGGNGTLGVPGEDLAGSWPASAFVGFYNGHPDFSQLEFDLAADRAVIVGNGNVALDVARILMAPLAALRQTDIADHALAALSRATVREVVILGRRGPLEAAFHNPELEELAHLPGVDIAVAGATLPSDHEMRCDGTDWHVRRKIANLRALADRPPSVGGRRIIFQFHSAVTSVTGHGRVEHIELSPTTASRAAAHLHRPPPVLLDAGLIFRATGYRGSPVLGLPFDETAAVIPNRSGRVLIEDTALPGVYVTGWAKRGCRGVIGSNRACAAETVDAVIEDWARVRLHRHAPPSAEAVAVLESRTKIVSQSGWRRIDAAERAVGALAGRPRTKFVARDAMMRAAAGE